MQKKIDDAANMWNKTKDLKYKELWYKLIKEFANGPHNTDAVNCHAFGKPGKMFLIDISLHPDAVFAAPAG